MFKKNSSFNVLYTTNIFRTHNFYEKLGLKIKQYEKDKVVVEFGDFDLHFILNTSEPFEGYKYIANSKDYGQGIIFYIETEDIQKASEMIPKAGGELKSEIFDNLWDCKELLFEDPNGYKFALYQMK
jgi:predicted enzyme related to lactoylglutathione lyase